MSVLRINRLHIEGFRGLHQPIEFDLSAPITLLFAPNGTGKTTVCEAVEWLLTAQVERLRDQQIFDSGVLRSVFADQQTEPFVRAQLQVGEKSVDLSRNLEGGWFKNKPSGKPERIGALLALLAPAAAAPNAHHKTAIALRQNWLRGTRFLSSEALAALVDTDDENIERRKQVFADLLGIRHLLDAERACLRYVEELSHSERALDQAVRKGEADIAAIKGEFGEEAAAAEEKSSDTIAAEIAAAERTLGLPTPAEPGSLSERIEAALVVHARQDRQRTVQQGALDQALATFARAQTLSADIVAADAQIETLSEQVKELEAKGREKSGECARLAAEKTRLAELRRLVNGARTEINQRFERLGRCLAAIGPISANNWNALRRALPESSWARSQIEERIADIDRALAGIKGFTDEAAALAQLRVELEGARSALPTDDQMSQLEEEVRKAEAAALAARGHVDALLQPVERIRSAGRMILAHAHTGDASDCPLCGYDWASSEALQQAIGRATALAPELVSSAEAVAKDREAFLTASRERHKAAVAQIGSVQRLQVRVAANASSVDQRRREIARLGGDPDDRNLIGTLGAIADRARLALAMAEVMESASQLAGVLDLSSLFVDERPLSRAFRGVDEIIVRRASELDRELEATTRQELAAVKDRDALRATYTDLQQQLTGRRTGRTEAATEIATLTSAWATASPGEPWTEENMRTVQTRLVDEAARLAAIDLNINAAKTALERETRIANLRALEEELKLVRARRRKLRARLSAGRSAAKTFNEAYARISAAQVRALSSVVNPLFSRMHANRVVDTIGLGEDENFLHWFASAGEATLDPKENFSQGQKQDLGLALFLARARSLGGTFFLDEPVSHLDDLNRVGLLDVLRVAVLEEKANVNLVITTASRNLARHLVEKFSNVSRVDTALGKQSPLRVVEITGNARTGVSREYVYPAR